MNKKPIKVEMSHITGKSIIITLNDLGFYDGKVYDKDGKLIYTYPKKTANLQVLKRMCRSNAFEYPADYSISKLKWRINYYY